MRPEDVTSISRIQQEILDKYPAMQKAAIQEEEVFSNKELKFEGDGRVGEPYETSASNFVKNIESRLKGDEEFSLAGPQKESLTPQNLKAYLDKNITNKELRAEIDGYIQEIEAVDDPVKYLDMFGANDVKDMILQVYVKEELRKAEDELTTLWATDKTVNFTTKLENLRTGKYKDDDGNIQSRDYNTYPRTPYQAAAMQVFQDEVIPNEMETTLRRSLVKLGKEGYLKDLSIDEVVLQTAIQQKSIENSRANENMVDKEYESYVRKRSGLGGLTKRHEAVESRRKELMSIKKEDVQKALGKKSKAYKAIEGYMEKNKNDDGTYNLSALSDALLAGIGYDFNLSRSRDNERREINNTAVIMVEGLESRNIPPLEGIDVDALAKNKDKIVKELAKFCGFGVEGRDHTPKLWKAVKQTGEAIAVGGAVHCIAPNVRKIILNNDVIANINIHIDNGTGIGLNTTQIIDVFQNIEVTIPMCFNLLQALGTGAAAGLVISVLEDLIFGNDIEFEKTCFNTDDFLQGDPKYTNLENYRKHLQTRDRINGTNTYGRVKFLLDKCEKEAKENPRTDGKGDWYYEEFLDLLHMVAGLGSNLNCAEIAGAKMYAKAEPKEVKPVEVEIAKAEKHWHTDAKKEFRKTEFDESELKDDEKVLYSKKADASSWAKLIEDIYNCSPDGKSLKDTLGASKATRILKIIQAITDNDYSRERLDKLYELSLKGASNLKNIQGLDYGKYYSILLGDTMPVPLKLPTAIYYEKDENGNIKKDENGDIVGITRCNISEDEHELVAPKAKKHPDKAPRISQGAAVGKVQRNKEVVVENEYNASLYFFQDETGKVYEYESKDERDQAVKEAEERTGKKAKDSTYEEMTGEKPEEEE